MNDETQSVFHSLVFQVKQILDHARARMEAGNTSHAWVLHKQAEELRDAIAEAFENIEGFDPASIANLIPDRP